MGWLPHTSYLASPPHCRNNAEHERKQKQHKLRIQWEEERCKRERAKTELEKDYRKQLSAKRRKENNDCQRRLEQARERLIKSQERLRQLLKEKDDRKKELIETLAKQKVKHQTESFVG